ncbi:MAG: tRNA lysidine(34) synthetase TilS [Candidatus Melainabacteria bacterium]|nr:tRNA lysidine(34) synthetase TilS [Candidatus Melainabacteria bacterium]
MSGELLADPVVKRFKKDFCKLLPPQACTDDRPFLPPLVVALSGGADSVFLLAALKSLYAEVGQEALLTACHVNHNVRAAALDDQNFCRELCLRLAVSFRCRTLEPGAGDEARLRKARYQALAGECAVAGAPYLVSGHHLDDQIETVLFRILRGTAAAGAVSMRGRSALPESESGLTILRPLLGWSKLDILTALEQAGLPHVEDASNAEASYSRNFLRHELLPLVEKRFPSVRQNIEHFRSGLERDEDYFHELVEEARGECFVYCREGVALSRKAFESLPEALKSRILVSFLRRCKVEPDYNCLARLRSVLEGRSPRQSIKDGLSAYLLDDGLLYLRPEGQEEDGVRQSELLRLTALMAPVLVPLPVLGGGSLTVPIAWLDMAIKVDCLAETGLDLPSSTMVQYVELSGGGALHFRPRRPGDRFFTSKERSFKTFLHRQGGRQGQTLKKLMQGGGEPATLAYGAAMRRLFGESGRGLALRLLPVLAAGEQVLWAPGLAVSGLCLGRGVPTHRLELLPLSQHHENIGAGASATC